MALQLIKIDQFPQVTVPEDWIVVAKGDGVAYKISKEDFKDWLGTVQSVPPKPISPSDPAPTLPGIYIPTENGSYPGGITVDLSEGYNQLVFDGTDWSKVVSPIDLTGYLAKADIGSNNLFSPDNIFPETYLNTVNGNTASDPAYTCTGYMAIDPTVTLYFEKNSGTPQWVAFYRSDFSHIGRISVGTGTTGQSAPLEESAYIRLNVSANVDDAASNIAALKIYQGGKAVNKISGEDIAAKILSLGNSVPDPVDPENAVNFASLKSYAVSRESVVTEKGRNLFLRSNIVEGSYVFQTGVIDGGAPDPANYVRSGPIPVKGNMPISYSRSIAPTTLGSLYAADGTWIRNLQRWDPVTETFVNVGSSRSGYAGMTPEGGGYVIANLSNSPDLWEDGINAFMLVHDDLPPTKYEEGYEYLKSIDGRELSELNSGKFVNNAFYGKTGQINGDSLTTNNNGTGGKTNNFISRAFTLLNVETIENKGISGSTVAEQAANPTTRSPLVNRIADMVDNADITVINIGTNDFNYSWTPFGDFDSRDKNTFYGALHLCCEQLQELLTGKKIIWLTPIKRAHPNVPLPNGTNEIGKTLLDYVNAIKEVCGYWGIDVYDQFNRCRLNPYMSAYASYFDNPAKTHPNDVGYNIMANDLAAFLNSVAP